RGRGRSRTAARPRRTRRRPGPRGGRPRADRRATAWSPASRGGRSPAGQESDQQERSSVHLSTVDGARRVPPVCHPGVRRGVPRAPPWADITPPGRFADRPAGSGPSRLSRGAGRGSYGEAMENLEQEPAIPTLDVTVLACPDSLQPATFYAELLGWRAHEGRHSHWPEHPTPPRRVQH